MTSRFALFTITCLGMLYVATAWAEAPASRGDWPQWRGPNRDGISLDQHLLKEWPAEGPKVIWQVESVGVGYSSLAIAGGRIYTQGDLLGVEHIIALDEKDGHTLWAVQPGSVGEQLDGRIANELKLIDKNGDGTVSEGEALARFGWDWNKYDRPGSDSPEDVAARRTLALFQELDKDGDGLLSWAEAGNALRDAFERIDAADPQADVAELASKRTAAFLKQLDKDQDGRISRQEARGSSLDRNFGRIDVRDPSTQKGDEFLTGEEIEASIKKNQPGRDEMISPDELRKFYVQTKLTGDGILNGQELRAVIGGYRNGMGDGPRGTPTLDGDRLYAEGGSGDLACLDAATGKTIWSVNLRFDFGGGVPGWGYSESPLVVDELLIVTPGGKQGTLLALDKRTGKPVWQSAEVTEGAHYSSPVVATIGGVRQIVQFANKSVFGVSLADGKSLWSYTAPANGTANCCTPIVQDDFVFASSAYGVGGGLVHIVPAGSQLLADEVYFAKKVACHHGGMVQVGDYLYSAGGGPLLCLELKTGKIVWQARGVGKGSLCVADGMLYVLGENHEMALAEATPEGYREHGRFKLQGHDRPAWAHPVVTGGRLYIRDQQTLTAYDVQAR